MASPGPYPQTFFEFLQKKMDFHIFEDFVVLCFSVNHVNMGPNGRQNFKRLLLPQITFESFQTFSEFSSQWSSEKYYFRFLKV